jgi:hypothetical protein
MFRFRKRPDGVAPSHPARPAPPSLKSGDVPPAQRHEPKGLGDHVETALTSLGITKERVEKFVGRPCGCAERRERLNALGRWAVRILQGKTDRAEEFLDEIIEGQSK